MSSSAFTLPLALLFAWLDDIVFFATLCRRQFIPIRLLSLYQVRAVAVPFCFAGKLIRNCCLSGDPFPKDYQACSDDQTDQEEYENDVCGNDSFHKLKLCFLR
jgi:hypothetical protein